MYCAEKHIPYVMCRLCIVCSLIVCGMPWRNCTDSLYAVVATFHFYLFRQCCTLIFFLIALELECWAHTYVLPPLWFANNNWMTIHPLFTFSICHSLKIPPTIIIKIGDTVHVNKSTCITLMLLYTFGVCSLTHLLACLLDFISWISKYRDSALQFICWLFNQLRPLYQLSVLATALATATYINKNECKFNIVEHRTHTHILSHIVYLVSDIVLFALSKCVRVCMR